MQNPSREAINTTQVTSVRSAAEPRVTRVVLIDSRDGIFNPLKPNSLDYHSYEFKQVEHKIGKCIGKSIEKNLLLRNH
jgi:hypothetical protein